MPFKIIRNDITKMRVDAIVNTASAEPTYETGVDRAIYQAAGEKKLLRARQKIGYLEEGDTALTPAFQLSAKYIIHAVSPIYIDGTCGEEEKLRRCYKGSLELAKSKRCKSIAFPLIATGNFAYPREEGMSIALQEIQKFLLDHDMMVYLVVFDDASVKVSGQLFNEIESYVDAHYVGRCIVEEYATFESVRAADTEDLELTFFDDEEEEFEDATESVPQDTAELPPLPPMEPMCSAPECPPKAPVIFTAPARSLQELVNNVGETFQQRLLRLISEKEMTTVEAYKAAYKDKKFFYKISKNVNYQPTKHTVYAFAIALQLSLDETKDLLASAGLAMSQASRFDIIMQYVFEHEIYDFYTIDCILYDFAEDEYFFMSE